MSSSFPTSDYALRSQQTWQVSGLPVTTTYCFFAVLCVGKGQPKKKYQWFVHGSKHRKGHAHSSDAFVYSPKHCMSSGLLWHHRSGATSLVSRTNLCSEVKSKDKKLLWTTSAIGRNMIWTSALKEQRPHLTLLAGPNDYFQTWCGVCNNFMCEAFKHACSAMAS